MCWVFFFYETTQMNPHFSCFFWYTELSKFVKAPSQKGPNTSQYPVEFLPLHHLHSSRWNGKLNQFNIRLKDAWRAQGRRSKDSQWWGKSRGAWRLHQTLSCRGSKLPVRATPKEPFLLSWESHISAEKMVLGKNLNPYKAQKRSSHHQGCCPTKRNVSPRATFTELSNLNLLNNKKH